MNIEQRNTQTRSFDTRGGHGIWNVVKLQIKENLFTGLYDLLYEVGTGGRKETGPVVTARFPPRYFLGMWSPGHIT